MWVIGKKYEGEVEGEEEEEEERKSLNWSHILLLSAHYTLTGGGWVSGRVVVVWDRGFTGNKYLRDVQSKAQNKTEEEFIIKVKTKVCHSIGGYKPEADYIIIA